MSDKPNGKSVPIWGVIVLVVSILLGGSGWVFSAIRAGAESKVELIDQRLSQIAMIAERNTLNNDVQDDLIAELRISAAISVENAKRLEKIEVIVNDILRRVK